MPSAYPQSRLAVTDARVVAATWALLAAVAVASLAPFVFGAEVLVAIKVLFAAFLASAALHVLLALMHRCPSCTKHPTIQGFRPVHQNSVGQSAVQGWGGVVVSILRRRRFTCIHCGTEFIIEG
jgi:H+/Cl- antiporter ClcA